jgi:hypothetical protein
MPVPLMLSDLPPTVEQPGPSPQAAAGEGALPSASPLDSSGPSQQSSWADVSLLSNLVAWEKTKPPVKPGWSVLPPWLGEGPDQQDHGPGDGGPGLSPLPLTQGGPGASTAAAEAGLSSPQASDGGSPAQGEHADPGDGSEPLTPDQVDELLLRADRQIYDPLRLMVTASGDVLVQFGDGQLAADRLWVNLENRYLRAEGDVLFNRNEQIIAGDTATYNLLQGSGEINGAQGELLLSTLGEDIATLPFADGALESVPIDYRLQQEGSISSATSPGGVAFGTDSRNVFGGERGVVTRLRFESETIFFDADGWYAEDLRLTNDPFSPPELELRGNNVRLTPLNEEESELYIESPRLVFDQGLTLPLLKERYILQQGQLAPDELNPLPTGIGIDGRDRDGLFIEREFSFNTRSPWQFSVVPQFYIGRWLGDSDSNLFDPANFGVVAQLNGPLGPRTEATGTLSLPGLDLENFTDRLRASFRTQQLIGDHELSLEYTYRDRLFNGSLGFQDVQTSLGVLLQSPTIGLGNTKIDLRYQVSGQYVTADTDRPELLPPGETVALTSLFRFQGAVDLSRNFTLWQGQPLPATPTEGLRYSPRQIVPSLSLLTGLQGVATYYTDDTVQETLEARVALSGQLGHLRRNFLDYTRFNIGYAKSFIGGETSPFRFDRSVDRTVLSGGVIQQLYGPLLAGFQTSFNLDSGESIDTSFILEYRRRAYGVLLQYNPRRETGFLGFRISDFTWEGRTEPFDSDDAAAETEGPGVMVE